MRSRLLENIDFNGDGQGDVAVLDTTRNAVVRLHQDPADVDACPFVSAPDVAVPAGTGTLEGVTVVDFDGDGRSDVVAVYRDGLTLRLQGAHADGTSPRNWTFSGASVDALVVGGDFDNDGAWDPAVFDRDAVEPQARWSIQASTAGPFTRFFGLPTDLPLAGRYTSSGQQVDQPLALRMTDADAGMRALQWYARLDDGNFIGPQFGLEGDVPLVMDLDGDRVTDLAAYRVADGRLFVQKSGGGSEVLLADAGTQGVFPCSAGPGFQVGACLITGTLELKMQGSGTLRECALPVPGGTVVRPLFPQNLVLQRRFTF